MSAKRGSENLGDYARKRMRQAEIQETQLGDSEPGEPTLPLAEPEHSSAEDSSDEPSDSEEEDPEELVMRSNEEVEGLFSQLENHFARTLQDAQIRSEKAERLKSRPSIYTKVNSRNPKTLSSRRKTAEINRQSMRDQGYPDIRAFFKQPQTSRELQREVESDTNDKSNGFLSRSGEPLGLNSGEVAATESDEFEELIGAADPDQRRDAVAIVSASGSNLESINEAYQEGRTAEAVVENEQEVLCVVEQAENWELASFNDINNAIEPGCLNEPTSDVDSSPTPPVPVSRPVSPIHHFAPAPPSRPPPKTLLALAEAVRRLGLTTQRVELHPRLRGRVVAMLAFLRFYTTLSLELNWTEASELAAVGAGKGKALARQLRVWVGAYLRDPKFLPQLRCTNHRKALIEDEDIAQEIKLHLLGVGKFFTAMDIVKYSAEADVMERWGLSRPISESTATRWLKKLDYRYRNEKEGYADEHGRKAYADGHEREDVVRYRQDVFLKKWFQLQERMVVRDKEGNVVHTPANPLLLLIPVTHDESTFYAHDQRKKQWVHSLEDANPVRKSEGTSLMVSDFCSPDLPEGWLRSKDRKQEARVFFKAGKNRDGYFNNDDILETTGNAINLFETHYPQESGVKALFLFDNAKTHCKRADDALSARRMPKSTRQWLPQSGVKMRDGTLPDGKPQPLWFPDNNPDPKKAGMFKGMEVILRERGLWPAHDLRAECEGFKCSAPDEKTDCCARRLLYSQPDFVNQKSKLQELVEGRGHHFLFYPKFHCELNFIEMCWGRAKFEYRMYGVPRNEAQQEEYVRKALDSVSPLTMIRFANRSARFMDAYRQGLSGSQAAWAGRKYHSHRTLPPDFVAEVKQKAT